MPLPSSIRTSTFHYNGASLRLQASFANLERLKQATGKSPFDYIFTAMDMEEVDDLMEMIRTLFFNLQADVEPYTEAQIHDWLFGEFMGFFNEENIQRVQETLGSIIGLDLKAKLEELAAEAANNTPSEDAASPKK